MRLRAVSIGESVPADRPEGAVHSVFESTLNIKLADGMLVSVLAQQHGNQPRGIRIDTPEGFTFDSWGLRADSICALRAGVLRFEGGEVAIDLRGAPIWKANLGSCSLDFSQQASPDNWRMVVSLLESCPASARGIALTALGAAGIRRYDTVTPFESRADESIRQLIEATISHAAPAASQSAARLIGFGPGLTPSGDDFLAGFMMALWVSGRGYENRICFARAFAERLAASLDRTTDISRGFVSDSIRQTASETTILLIEAIAGVGDVRRAAQDALAVGSTSGADSVAGLVVGLSVWRQELLAIPALRF